jgi:hypothetical protein
MYNILGVMKGLNDNAKSEQLNESVKQPTVYENVESKGSIMNAVKSLAGKFAKFNESAKPDFLDMDKDGDKKEPMKKAAKDKNNAKGAFKDMFGGDAKDLTSKLKIKESMGISDELAAQKIAAKLQGTPDLNIAKIKQYVTKYLTMVGKQPSDVDYLAALVNNQLQDQGLAEGQGPYELYNPKHPKFKANYDKWMAKNPGKTLSDFIEAMKKREHGLNESQAVVIGGKEVDLNSLEFENIHQWDAPDYSDAYCVAASFTDGTPLSEVEINQLESKYGAEVHTAIHNSLHEGKYDEPEAPNADAVAKRKRLQALKDRQEDERAEQGNSGKSSGRFVPGKAYGGAAQKDAEEKDDLDEVAPPGKKAERMVKHIKKGYAKDGNLSKKEKGIAYATAWKAHNKGQVEEGVAFGDTVKNSTPSWKKAKPMKLKESRMLQEGDYFYESIAKALCDKNPNLDTAGNEFVTAVRQEMVAQGITPNKARNILLMDEDFLSDVATSYGHYCKEVAEDINQSNIPSPTNVNPVTSPVGQELDEIAKLAGLPTKQASCESCGMLESSCACQHEEALDESSINEAASRKDFRMVANLLKNIPDEAKRKELANHHADIFKQQNPRFKREMFLTAAGVVNEADMSEGNEFSGALAAAKASGAKEFEVDGKRYTVKEDINVNITANGQEDALNLFRKLSGMEEVAVQPAAQAVELPQDAASAIAQGVVEPVEVELVDADAEVAEERDIQYTNTPNEKIGGLDTAIPSGTDLNRSKKQYKKEYPGDNPMAVKEEQLWKSYESLINSVKD